MVFISGKSAPERIASDTLSSWAPLTRPGSSVGLARETSVDLWICVCVSLPLIRASGALSKHFKSTQNTTENLNALQILYAPVSHFALY